MAEHGVDWAFEWDGAIRRFGAANHRTNEIQLSRHLVAMNDEKHVRNTILHEIAHALAPAGEWHGKEWKRIAQSIGCTGNRCYSHEVAKPLSRFIAFCRHCGTVMESNRVADGLAHGLCCDVLNANKHSREWKSTV